MKSERRGKYGTQKVLTFAILFSMLAFVSVSIGGVSAKNHASDISAVQAGGINDPNLILPPASLPLQPVSTPFVDPVFNTTMLRVSNTSVNGGFETQIYNQLQAFSSDNTYLLLDGSNGFVVRRVDDFSLVTGLDTSGWNDPRWYQPQPHVIVHFDSNDDTVLRLQFTDMDTLITTTVYTFPAQYEYIQVPQSFDELSEDGRWLAGMATRNDSVSVIFTLDIQNLTLGAQLPIPDLYAGPCQPDPIWGEVEPDWVGVSPLGNYLVVQWVRDGTTRCSGLETFDIQTGDFIGRVSDHHHHGDIGVDSDGVTEFFMTTELSSPQDNNRPALSMRLLPGNSTVSPPIYLQVVDWSDEDHISCQGPNGVCLVSWGNFGGLYDWPFENELFLQYTDGSVLRLVHHRSSKCGYWVQPRASISRDGSYVVFASDWGEETNTSSCKIWKDPMGRGDPYIIDLEENGMPINPTVSIYTDITNYKAGDFQRLGLDVINPNCPYQARVNIWIETLNGKNYTLLNKSYLLPANLNYTNPNFKVFRVPNIISGNYTWYAQLANTSTGDLISSSSATWTFSATTSEQFEDLKLQPQKLEFK